MKLFLKTILVHQQLLANAVAWSMSLGARGNGLGPGPSRPWNSSRTTNWAPLANTSQPSWE